ncbi:hypothetical protein KOR42_11450 [Thalassoglobus neptunius]|uniref:Uncharacterized protein n=2 Tax=Thalassoglobus neptunius TaxID=1938619 RepID=A0A5C5X589_9PLAN|nr:hypothetical protein KOR42_11450 [Thalassoglobus neptunius]
MSPESQSELSKISENLSRLTSAVELLVESHLPKPRPIDLLGDMSKEEIAIILVARGWSGTKKELAENLGVGYSTLRSWPSFSRVWNTIKSGERLGEIVRKQNGKGQKIHDL